MFDLATIGLLLETCHDVAAENAKLAAMIRQLDKHGADQLAAAADIYAAFEGLEESLCHAVDSLEDVLLEGHYPDAKERNLFVHLSERATHNDAAAQKVLDEYEEFARAFEERHHQNLPARFPALRILARKLGVLIPP